MSVDKAKEFLIKVSEDDRTAAEAEKAYVEALTKVASREGYALTTAELTQAMAELGNLPTQIPEEMLAQVSGGFFTSRDLDTIGLAFGKLLRKIGPE